ncbi:hypothetical protein GDO81_016443 [Engystomops pustulosus]|uniref:C2 domain-containing protein n=1 Tax=Engystomops pustulosus TaxID=76066 RepID=A0AAV7AYA7_ENGPU|nr:hypothetical protein GDO81_016443 [Engystomops pustulosus]
MESKMIDYRISVITSPPGWEIGIYIAGALTLLGVVGLYLWKLYKSGNYPSPSPFPNYDYRYLKQKYGTSHSEVKKKIQRNAYSVLFDEKFSIPLDPLALEENSLRFSIFAIDGDERNVSTGVAELKLSDLDLTVRPFNTWIYLQDVNKAADAVGEILLSLSYLPTAERLTVVVVKGKNLLWTEGKTTADPFVKVYLLQDGRKISKKKTAVKRDDRNPVFNEAMIFSVPAIVLQDLSLRITVAECCDDGRAENVGHVIIGPSVSGMGMTHWNQMLATLRKPVSMWHQLRRN